MSRFLLTLVALLTRPAVLVTVVVLVVLLHPDVEPALRLVRLLEVAPDFPKLG